MNKETFGQKNIEAVRCLRQRSDMTIKPSPYLKTKLDNSNVDVVLRNYQKIGVMNMLLSPKMILGDDTGLGKTLQVLTMIGYVWLKEPDYIPIIVTNKSALFQWASETNKFMNDMDAVVVCGEPYKRHESYSKFFSRNNRGKRQILLLTYDMIQHDAEESVVKEKGKSPRPSFSKELKKAKADKKAAEDHLTACKEVLQNALVPKSSEYKEYARRAIDETFVVGQLHKPAGWGKKEDDALEAVKAAKKSIKAAAAVVTKLNDEFAPTKVVPGIISYMNSLLMADPNAKYMLIMDEIHKLKNHKSKFHEKTFAISKMCDKLIGMTATPVKNRLMEFFSLFHIIEPKLFPKITHFQNEYCVMKMQRISGGRQVPVVVGYKNLDKFVSVIEPYYLSRKKHDVAKELPSLITKEIECELTSIQDELYELAEAGALVKKSGEGEDEESPAEILASLTLCQQAVDSPDLIADEDGKPFKGESSKVQALLDILEETPDQKVIVYSRFEKMISSVGAVLEKNGIKYVRVTGKESDPKKREYAKNVFQDKDSGCNVILITDAGSESINLQAAESFVFIDQPFSWGVYNQLIGRMIRIGSDHKSVVAYHLMGIRKSGDQTIDHHVLKTLRNKKKLSDKVSGESIIGALQFNNGGDSSKDIMSAIREANAGKQVKKPTKVIKSFSTKKVVTDNDII